MTAPEPARSAYWTTRVTVLVVIGVGLVVGGVMSGGGPAGYVIAALCLLTAAVLAVVERGRRQ